MNEAKLKSCSPIIQETLSHLERFYQEKGIYNIYHSPSIYILDRFESQYVDEFFEQVQNTSTDSISRLILEYPNYLTYFYKMFDSTDQNRRNSAEIVQKVFEIQKNKQQNSGRIMNEHQNQLRSLVNISPKSEATKKALRYYEDEIREDDIKGSSMYANLYGSIALMELNYDDYKGLAKRTIETCKKHMLDAVEYDGDDEMNMPTFKNSVAILLASQKNLDVEIDEEIKDICVRNLEGFCETFCKNVSGDENWDIISKRDMLYDEEVYYRRISPVAEAVHALTAAGLGYSISGFKSEWMETIADQRHNQSKPRFVSTLPAAQVEERETTIHDTAKRMISNANDSLRIASLRIDMLHEEIITKSDLKDVEVKILSNKKGGKGDRRKMASAVMNELVRRTKGGVRVDHLTHSRLIISDNHELLVTSADLTRDQLIDEFNGGIYTKDPDTIANAIEAFDKIWSEADAKNVGN